MLIAIGIYAAPLRAVLKCLKANSLMDLNPIPLVFIVNNSFGWFLYGILVSDYYILASNVIGIILGIFYSLVCFRIAPYTFLRKISATLLIGITFLLLAAVLSFITFSDRTGIINNTQRTLMGASCIVILVVFYFSPLTVFYNVIKTRNSIFLHRGLSILSFVNAVVWTTYGIVIGDWMLTGPNAAGVVLSFIQLVLMLVFPRRALVPELDAVITVDTTINKDNNTGKMEGNGDGKIGGERSFGSKETILG